MAIMYAGIVLFTSAMYQTLRGITGSSAWAVISPEDMLDVIAAVTFRGVGGTAVPGWVAVLVVSALIGASIWILERRVRAVEVVA